MTAADICRERGWRPGDVLEEHYCFPDGSCARWFYRLTAIGESACLGVRLGEILESCTSHKVGREQVVSIYEKASVTNGVRCGNTWKKIDRLPWEVPDADGL